MTWSEEAGSPDPWGDLRRPADELAYVAASLRRLGVSAVILTLATLALVVILTLVAYVNVPFPESAYERNLRALALVPPGVSALLALAAGILFDGRRRRGYALYENLAEEVQYRIQDLDRRGFPAEELRPPFWLREATRTFSNAAQLPVVPGSAGPAALVGINALTMLAAVALLTAQW